MPARIQQLENGARLDSFFVLSDVRAAETKTGATYYSVTLRDITGRASGRIWSAAAVCPAGPPAPGVYWVTGRVESYREELQFIIDKLAPYQPAAGEYDQLVPASRWPADVLFNELRLHIEQMVRAEPIRRLLLTILQEPDVVARFPVWPAASSNHHAFRSGLAEHTLSMMRLATTVADHYAAYHPGLVNRDLLIAGVMLHDIGKVWELEAGLLTEYTTVGRLVGHIPMGAMLVERVARTLGDIPQSLIWEIQHLVLAHHGEYEYGSPKRPKTVEAQILHYVDQIDAKVQVFSASTPGWQTYNKSLSRPTYAPTPDDRPWAEVHDGPIGPRGPGLPAVDLAAPALPADGATLSLGSGRRKRSAAHAEPTASEAPAEVPAQPPAPAAAEPAAVTRSLSLFDGL